MREGLEPILIDEYQTKIDMIAKPCVVKSSFTVDVSNYVVFVIRSMGDILELIGAGDI